MDLGDFVVVDHPRHPLNGCLGKIVGRRGNYAQNDILYLVFIALRMRSYLIPGSALRLAEGDAFSTVTSTVK